MRVPMERLRSFLPIDSRAYDDPGLLTPSVFSDTAWCAYCGEQMAGVFGGTIERSVREHRKQCRGGKHETLTSAS